MTASEARTYANVAFETALQGWIDGLAVVAEAIGRTPGVAKVLEDPGPSFEEKQSLLVTQMPDDLPRSVRNFLFAMLANGDIAALGDVLEEMHQLAAAGGGQRLTIAEITSAVELDSQERQAIEQKLVDEFGSNLDFRYIVDPAILGGIVVRVGDKLLDRSLASRLAGLRQSLGVSTD
ncbi:MAG: ATP synthase F1 subunit delta [Chloroflexota bacterium]|nr:ATP synthase F1 subunit delta [Chloroflexota bacterium]